MKKSIRSYREKMTDKENSISKDLKTLSQFFNIYCSANHKALPKSRLNPKGILFKYYGDNLKLCDECHRRFLYAAMKRIICPIIPSQLVKSAQASAIHLSIGILCER